MPLRKRVSTPMKVVVTRINLQADKANGTELKKPPGEGPGGGENY